MEKEKIVVEGSGKDKIYRKENGETIRTYQEDVGWIAQVNLSLLRSFLEMTFEDDEAQQMAFIALALLQSAEKKIYEATGYIEENFGRIEIEKACWRQGIEQDTILGIVFKPCKEAENPEPN